MGSSSAMWFREAQEGGPIALVQDGDVIHIDAVKNTLDFEVSDEELAKRRKMWVAPPLKVKQGYSVQVHQNCRGRESRMRHGCLSSDLSGGTDWIFGVNKIIVIKIW